MKKLILCALALLLLLTGCSGQAKRQTEMPAPSAESEQAEQKAPEEVQTEPAPQDDPKDEPAPETKPETEKEPEKADAPEPEETDEPKQEETPMLSEEEQRRQSIRRLLEDAPIQDAIEELDTGWEDELCRTALTDYLTGNWEELGQPFEDGDLNVSITAMGTPDTYLIALLRKNDYPAQYYLMNLPRRTLLETKEVVPAEAETKISAEIMNLVGNAKYSRELLNLCYSEALSDEQHRKLNVDIQNALYSFESWMADRWEDFKQIMEPPFYADFTLEADGTYVLTVTGETFFTLELRWLPAKGVWVEGARALGSFDSTWTINPELLTDDYLMQTIRELEDAGLPEFESPAELSEDHLFRMFLALIENTGRVRQDYRKERDGAYHFTNYDITTVLSSRLSEYTYDITQNPLYDAARREILCEGLPETESHFLRLKEKALDGNRLTMVWEIYNADPETGGTLLETRQYELEFYFGGYQYCSVRKAEENVTD